MRQFTDGKGREWDVAVTHGSIKRAQTLAGVDLYKFGDGEPPLAVRIQEPALFCDVLYALCQPQCRERGLSAADFGESLGGGAIFDARHAFFGEYRDFFLGLRAPDAAAALANVTEFFETVMTADSQAIATILSTPSDSCSTSPVSSA